MKFKNHVYICVKRARQVCKIMLANVYSFEHKTLVKASCIKHARPYLHYRSITYFLFYLEVNEL